MAEPGNDPYYDDSIEVTGTNVDPTRSLRAQGPKKRIRILMISYHFPPLNVIASFRSEAFAKYLPDHGIDPTVITLRWETLNGTSPGEWVWHGPDAKIVTEEFHGSKVIRLPRRRTLLQRTIDMALRIPVLSTIVVALSFMCGVLNPQNLFSHLAFKKFLSQHLRTESYDVVIAMMSPDEHVALGAWIERRFGIPFIADYRDTFNNRMMSPDFRPTPSMKVKLGFQRAYHRKWVSRSSLLTSVSAPLIAKLAEVTGAENVMEIRNGYDPEKVIPDMSAIDGSCFKITYAGRIYPDQEVRPFIRTMEIFLSKLSPGDVGKVKVRFYGIQLKSMAQILSDHLPASLIDIHVKRIPNTIIYEAIAESSILLLFDIRTPGAYTGKFMDYVGCRRNILMIPSDEGVISSLIEEGRLGLATRDPETAAHFLHERFKEWRSHGRPIFHGNETVIGATARSAQVVALAKAIMEIHAKRVHDQKNP